MKQINLSPKQIYTAFRPFKHTFEVLEGTPRSGKTTAGHFRYANYLNRSRDTNHLITAYNQEQAYRLFIDGDGTGLMHIFDGLCDIKHDEHGSHLEVHTAMGVKKVYYKGAGKSNSVGAVTGMSLGSVVHLEINLLNMLMIQECFRRTFAAQDRFHLADLNPPSPHHPVIKEVFEVQDMEWLHWTPQDNPALTEQRKKEIYTVLSRNPYLLQRDWFGQRVMPQGVIYSMFDMKKNIWPHIKGEVVEMFFSGDGGQSDATSFSCYLVVKHESKFKLLRVASYHHSGKETGEVRAMSRYAKEISQFIKWCHSKFDRLHTEIFIDPACKSLREELHTLGHYTKGADNNAHDVNGASKGLEVGIERLQNTITEEQYILIEVENDDYDHYPFLREVGMYCRDSNGKPVDDYNHCLDETRYANNYFSKRYLR